MVVVAVVDIAMLEIYVRRETRLNGPKTKRRRPMIVRIFGIPEPIEDKEPEFLMKLEQGNNYVELILVKPDGTKVQNGILLRITKDMKLYRFGSINNNLGLPLDANSQLEIDD